jgi:hypothetical protein
MSTVVRREIGRARESSTNTIFVDNPPLDRPRTPRSATCFADGTTEFLPFDRSPCEMSPPSTGIERRSTTEPRRTRPVRYNTAMITCQ